MLGFSHPLNKMSSTMVAPIPANDPLAPLSVATAEITKIKLKVAMNSTTNTAVRILWVRSLRLQT